MKYIVINSRGEVYPKTVTKAPNDVLALTFDFDLFFDDEITNQTTNVENGLGLVSASTDAKKVIVQVSGGRDNDSYDLTVQASSGLSVKTATLQVEVEDYLEENNGLSNSTASSSPISTGADLTQVNQQIDQINLDLQGKLDAVNLNSAPTQNTVVIENNGGADATIERPSQDSQGNKFAGVFTYDEQQQLSSNTQDITLLQGDVTALQNEPTELFVDTTPNTITIRNSQGETVDIPMAESTFVPNGQSVITAGGLSSASFVEFSQAASTTQNLSQNVVPALDSRVAALENEPDLTGAEIKTLYESEADTNAFTDAEKTKLANLDAAGEANVSSNLSLNLQSSGIDLTIIDDNGLTGATATLPLASEANGLNLAGLISWVDQAKLNTVQANASPNTITDLSTVITANSITVESSDGNDITLQEADPINNIAGIVTAQNHADWDGARDLSNSLLPQVVANNAKRSYPLADEQKLALYPDLAGLPDGKYFLESDGTNVVLKEKRDFFYRNPNGLINNLDTFENHDTRTFTLSSGGTFEFTASGKISYDSSQTNVEVRLQVVGSSGAIYIDDVFYSQEPSDIAGVGVDFPLVGGGTANTGTDVFDNFFFRDFIGINANDTVTVSLAFRGQQAGNFAAIHISSISVEEVLV